MAVNNGFSAARFDFAQHAEGTIVGGARPDRRREPADGFQIVIEDVRVRGEHRFDGRIGFIEIGHEHFNDNSRVQFTNLFDGRAKMIRAAVLQIIARHGGNHHVFQPHPARGFGDTRGFVGFEGERLGGGDGAKTAGARAAIAGDHERGRAFAPAFPMVRALGAFADRVQLQFVQQPARAREAVGRGQRDAQPFRQTRTRFQFSCRHFSKNFLREFR